MPGFRRTVALTLITAFLSGLAFGFDTAPHSDLSRTVLAENGFSEDAIKGVQVENWLTDYFSTSPTIDSSKRDELEKLHCDNLFTTKEVTNYFGWLIANLRSATQKAAREDDPLAMIVTLGIGLHTMQDLYAHSNWVETHPRKDNGQYRTETLRVSTDPGLTLFTGKYPSDRKTNFNREKIPADVSLHGDYKSGVNKDSPTRPRWDEAYVFAYVASHELVEAMAKWAEETRPGFWKKVQGYAVDAQEKKKLDYDVAAARSISMWIKGRGQDGHWKGDRSGSDRLFGVFSPRWIAADSSKFVRKMKDSNIAERIAENLYTDITQPSIEIPRFLSPRRAIIVRTTFVGESKDAGFLKGGISALNGSDFYARITIGGQEYWDRVVQASNQTNDPWYEIHFVDASERNIPVSFSVFEEDNLDPKDDPEMDLNSIEKLRKLKVIFDPHTNLISGDVNGKYDSRQNIFTSTGAKPDNNRVVIMAFVTQTLLQ